jgi:hypothetical protein
MKNYNFIRLIIYLKYILYIINKENDTGRKEWFIEFIF